MLGWVLRRENEKPAMQGLKAGNGEMSGGGCLCGARFGPVLCERLGARGNEGFLRAAFGGERCTRAGRPAKRERGTTSRVDDAQFRGR